MSSRRVRTHIYLILSAWRASERYLSIIYRWQQQPIDLAPRASSGLDPEASAVHYARPRLLVLLLGDPHPLKAQERRENRATPPRRVLARDRATATIRRWVHMCRRWRRENLDFVLPHSRILHQLFRGRLELRTGQPSRCVRGNQRLELDGMHCRRVRFSRSSSHVLLELTLQSGPEPGEESAAMLLQYGEHTPCTTTYIVAIQN